MPEVHGPKKGIDPNLRPEWLVKKISKPSRKFQNKKKRARSSRTKKSNCRSSKYRT